MIAGIEILEATTGKVPPPARDDGVVGDRSKGVGSLKVLIVEDESIIAWALQSLVEDLGHEVLDVLSSGEAAIAAAAQHEPELILMDINLGHGIDGIEAAQHIQAARAVTLIFVSAYGDETTRARIRDRVPGALLLTKPVSASAIRRAIEATSGTRH
jgi:CheY-like chemotaxis protein